MNPNELVSALKQIRLDLENSGIDLERTRSTLKKIHLDLAFRTDQESLLLARETVEYSAILAVLAKDFQSFDKFVIQAKAYYLQGMPPSENERVILSLWLFRLLASHQFGEFHLQLELINSTTTETDPYYKKVVMLERYLMEGNYLDIMKANCDTFDFKDIFMIFCNQFKDSLRTKAGESLRAYSISSPDLCRSFGIEDMALEGLVPETPIEWAAFHEVSARNMINNMVYYATEHDRIV